VVGFITLVQLRPGSRGRGGEQEAGLYETEWENLTNGVERLGAHVTTVFSVLGNEFDLLIIGEAADPRTLHRIDALCKTLGFVARTHPAVEASEYAALVRETNEIVHGTRIGKSDTRRKEA
jgi:uncharacterized protein with GYD domain